MTVAGGFEWEARPADGRVRAGSLLLWAPFIHIDQTLRVLTTTEGRLRALTVQERERFNEGDREALVVSRGKMRKALVLAPPDERGNWWLLPLLGDYGQDTYPLNSAVAPIVTFGAVPELQLAAGYLDMRQAALVNRSVIRLAGIPGQLTRESTAALRLLLVSYVQGHWPPS
jgi:hypothetical protein